MELINRPYIKRISILGGEPLAAENVEVIYKLLDKIREKFPDKTIWLYSGYTWEQLFYDDEFDIQEPYINQIRRGTVLRSDVFVDGQFIDTQKDISLAWRGSRNQRVINPIKSIVQGTVILYCD